MGIGSTTQLYRWTFGNVEFDEGRWQLTIDGQAVELDRKTLEVLQCLLHHPQEVVTKEELMATVWEGRVVVDAVLTNAVGRLRSAIGTDAIRTVPKVGYRLNARVTRKDARHVPVGSRFTVGDSVPRRENWILEEALARRGDGEVWRARHAKTGEITCLQVQS